MNSYAFLKWFVLFGFIFSCKSSRITTPAIDGFHYTINKKVEAENGAVVSAHPLASKAGIEMLKRGGNAFDAAIATQFALAVVYPNAGNLGGGGFLVARVSDGKLLAIDYREMAPMKAHRDMYLDQAGEALLELSQHGHLSVGIPGTVAGLFASHRFAKLPMKDLIQPAIDLAEKGFAISEREARSLNSIDDELRKYNTVMPVFLKSIVWKAGDTLMQTDLANTLKRIRDNGQKGFYEGETARLIVEEMKRGKGIITTEDLKGYVAKERTPHVFNYKGYSVVGMPMPSSGGLLLNQMLKMIEGRPIGSYGFHSVEAVQLMIEAERRAFADRAKYMGDADHYKVPVKELTSDEYLRSRMNDFTPGVANKSSMILPGNVAGYESEETTHLSV